MKTISEYTIYCTEEQTRKALELGAKISWCEKERKTNEPTLREKGKCYKYFIPTAEQMIGWLETQGLFITIDKSDGGHIFYKILKENKNICEWNIFPSRKEATLAAIDSALEYLEGQKNIM